MIVTRILGTKRKVNDSSLTIMNYLLYCLNADIDAPLFFNFLIALKKEYNGY